ncbi:MAG: hypothetical protein GTN49_09855 [candidate division Zixibacteria bacterium]|nr:hypothetical protein [candidate division Zixibacteria bacterium]
MTGFKIILKGNFARLEEIERVLGELAAYEARGDRPPTDLVRRLLELRGGDVSKPLEVLDIIDELSEGAALSQEEVARLHARLTKLTGVDYRRSSERPPVPGAGVIVIVSQGHYEKADGSNTGAEGVGGLQEFDVVTAVGESMHRNLAGRPGMEVHLAPRTNIGPQLELAAERLRANAEARLAFVDVHANAYPDPRARSTETWVSSEHSKSVELGVLIHENLLGALRRHDPEWRDRGIKYTAWAIMRSDKAVGKYGMDRQAFEERYYCVLPELGFVTNYRDAVILANPSVQQELGCAMAEAVATWGGV